MEELGLSSLERVELLMALERRFGATLDEGAYAHAGRVGDLKRLFRSPPLPGLPRGAANGARRFSGVESVGRGRTDPARQFAAVASTSGPSFHLGTREGRGEPQRTRRTCDLRANHQSHLDVPALMLAFRRNGVIGRARDVEGILPAHFYPERHTLGERFTNGAELLFVHSGFQCVSFSAARGRSTPNPSYAGELVNEGWCIVIFPEGKITENGRDREFHAGRGNDGIASQRSGGACAAR